ncbi:ATP-binding protein [Streptomyces sp. NPDC005708]|uniref:ATP-binding protein n=1 Tax=Streptomyces sp. NPDC005708 TaxID=3154564 RepID=UPI00340FE6E1
MDEWGLEGLVDGVKLIVSELVTNAVRHGTGPIRLRLIQHQVLTVEVTDADFRSPRPRNARTVDEHGRGLFLVAQLSSRWGTRPAQDGKVVRAEADLAHASGPQSSVLPVDASTSSIKRAAWRDRPSTATSSSRT